jgi:hypothetical protein
MSGEGGMRVRWKCGAIGCTRHEHMGTTWVADPHLKLGGDDDYHVAVKLGLCADPLPLNEEHYALVQFDDLPGVLQCHPWSELEAVYE